MAELMGSGIELMFAGMGIVFSFLAMLVVAIDGMSSLIQRFFPEAPASVVVSPVINSSVDKTTVAAITDAVHQYRNSRQYN